MAINRRYSADVEAILAHRHDNGSDLWATPDGRLAKGGPFSTLESALLLLELGMPASGPLMKDVAKLVFSSWQEDGRFRLSPSGAVYPCHTINAANVLCHLGHRRDRRLQKTFQHLLEIQHTDGGWRCNKFSFGRGLETEFSNPGPTLTALSAFRFTDLLNKEPAIDRSVEFLLDHWTTRRPLGPCHYGIGTLFMQPEYPFGNYNLFPYVYVLSFFDRAKDDRRFIEALSALEASLVDGKFVVGRTNRQLADFAFCRKSVPSELATKRFREIQRRVGKG